MTAAKIKITIEQGADFVKEFIWKSGDPLLPVDLTGFTARMQVRPSISSTTKLLDLTTENDGILLGGVLGTIKVQATAALTAAMVGRTAVYDLELIYPGGAVKRFAKGSVTIDPEVTR